MNFDKGLHYGLGRHASTVSPQDVEVFWKVSSMIGLFLYWLLSDTVLLAHLLGPLGLLG